MKRLVAVALLWCPFAVLGADVQIEIVNDSQTDLTVESAANGSDIEVAPSESREAIFHQPQWLRFGQEAYEYDIEPLPKGVAAIEAQDHFESWQGFCALRLATRGQRWYWTNSSSTQRVSAEAEQESGPDRR